MENLSWRVKNNGNHPWSSSHNFPHISAPQLHYLSQPPPHLSNLFLPSSLAPPLDSCHLWLLSVLGKNTDAPIFKGCDRLSDYFSKAAYYLLQFMIGSMIHSAKILLCISFNTIFDRVLKIFIYVTSWHRSLLLKTVLQLSWKFDLHALRRS